MNSAFQYQSSPFDRMFVYVWSDVSDGEESKFGERWVFADENPNKEISDRIRESLGVRKDRFDEGKIVIHQIWDVSEYAKKINRFFQRSRVDDEIRSHIGFRKGNVGEIHLLNGEDMSVRINEYLKKQGQPLLPVGLAIWQSRAVEEITSHFNRGESVGLFDSCARSGKTISSSAVGVEINAPIIIIASYVLTSFTSFKKDRRFEQFKNDEHIDCDDNDYLEKIKKAIHNKKIPVGFLSMCKGGKGIGYISKRDERIKSLFKLPQPIYLIIDEADYGSWRPGQADILESSFRYCKDKCILMTGTNSDRAVGPWTVDFIVQTTYLELLMEKKQNSLKNTTYSTSLRNFQVDRNRHELVVDVEFYQMDLLGLTIDLHKKEPNLFMEDGKFLPSWTKFSKDPIKSKGFWVGILQSIFEGKLNHDELSLEYQTRSMGTGVYMMFLPSVMRSREEDNKLNEAADIARQTLTNFEVVVLSGSNGVSNKKAEKYVKEKIEVARRQNKNVLILSTCLAQRSFSIGEINTVFLAYDAGQIGSTIQKISRGLTPDKVGKIGRIVSLSFDVNRDDKLDSLVLETASNYRKTHNKPSIKDALIDVLKTIDIFKCTENGRVKIDVDEYLKNVVNQSRIANVIGRMAQVSKIPDDLREAILSNSLNRYSPKSVSAPMGETGIKKPNSKRKKSKQSKDDTKKLKEKIIAICENLDIIVCGTGKTNMTDAFSVLRKDKSLGDSVTNMFGMKWQAIEELINSGAINLEFVELVKY